MFVPLSFITKTNYRPYLFLFFIVALIISPALKNDFLRIDDYDLIVNVPEQEMSVGSLFSFFEKPLGVNGFDDNKLVNKIYYRPILDILYLLNKKIWGINPVGFHITNILFHLLNTFILYRVGLTLFHGGKVPSFIAASLFAVHPIHHELIGRVAMNENIYGFLAVSTFSAFLHDRKNLALLTFSLTLFSKESAVIIPLAVVILGSYRTDIKKAFMDSIPYFLLAFIFLGVRGYVIGFIPGEMDLTSGWPYILIMISALTDYLKLMVVPYPLSPFHSMRIYTSIFDPRIITSLVIFAILLTTSYYFRRNKSLSCLLVLTFIMLIPPVIKANSIVMFPDASYIAERQLYVPSMFFLLFLAGIIKDNKYIPDASLSYGVAFVLALFVVMTISATGVWQNDETVRSKIIVDAPYSNVAHIMKGAMFCEKGNYDEALREYTASFRPNVLVLEMANKQGRNRIIGKLDTAVLNGLTPSFADVHFEIGRIYFIQNKFDIAIRKFNVALRLHPDHKNARYYLAKTYLMRGEYGLAKREFDYLLFHTSL